MLRFLRGCLYPWRGLQFALVHPGLLRYFPGPAVLAVGLLFAEILLLRGAIHHFLAHSRGVTILAAWIGGLVLALLLFLALQGLVCAPFCDRASARTELYATGTPPPVAGARAQAISVVHGLLRTGFYLGALITVFVAGLFVPGLWVLGLVLSSLYAALDFLDYPATRRRFRLSRKLGLLRAHPASMLGFGLSASLLTAVPLVGLVTAPIAAIGATLLFLDLERGSE
jgi:uncharacterized protein involved in cysteine biosynthesis